MGIFGDIADGIGDAASSIADGIEDIAGDAVDFVGGMVPTDLGDAFSLVTQGPILSFAYDSIDFAVDATGLEELDGVVGDLVDVATAGSLGSMLNMGMDKLGLPDWAGDMAGGVLDVVTQNYAGAAANGLDALQDVAKACGAEELAPYLKLGGQVTGMFAGGSAAAGQIGSMLGSSGLSLDMVQGGMRAFDAFSEGDYLGAATGLAGTFGGDLGPLEGIVGGLGDEAAAVFGEYGDEAMVVAETMGKALADGKLDASDLQHLPVDGLAGQLGLEGLAAELTGPFQQFGAGMFAGSPFEAVADQLMGDLFGAVQQAVPPGVDADMIAEKAEMARRLVLMAGVAPDALDVIADLLGQAHALHGEVDLAARHVTRMRP